MSDRKERGQTSYPIARPMSLHDACVRIRDVPAINDGAIGYLPSALALLSMPHIRPKGMFYKRDGGLRQLHITADQRFGLPYGRVARLLLIWLATTAVQSQSPHIDMGRSQSAFFRSLGITGSRGQNGTITRYADQLDRLFHCHFTVTNFHPTSATFQNHLLASSGPIFGSAWRNGDRDLLCGPIHLNHDFFAECLEHAVPIDLRAVCALQSTIGLDLYIFLTYRLRSLRKPLRLSWATMLSQIGYCPSGDNPSAARTAKARLKKAFWDVLTLYPQARVTHDDHGVELRRSPASVAIRSDVVDKSKLFMNERVRSPSTPPQRGN